MPIIDFPNDRFEDRRIKVLAGRTKVKLHQLRIFESVARHLNITSAAEELHMSQPAVSLQLKQLEQEYALKFYESNNHGVQLTGHGQAFLDAIRPLLAHAEQIEKTFKVQSRSYQFRVLTVGCSHMLSATVLPEILKTFKETYPEVQLVLETADSRTIEGWIRLAKIEIALISKPSYLQNCVYQDYQAQTQETVAFIPGDSPIAQTRMTLHELAKHPLVVRGGSSCVESLMARGLPLTLALQCHTPEAVKTAVQGGMGIGLIFRRWIEADLAKGDFRVIEVPELKNIAFKSSIVYGSQRPLSGCAKDFLRLCMASPKAVARGHYAQQS
jgi:DNA-binding transcriptional LysR family regulator